MSTTRTPPMPMDSNTDGEAMNWFVTVQNSPDLSPKQRQAFEAWKGIPANALAYARAQQIAGQFRQGIDQPEVVRKRKEIQALVRERRRSRQRACSFGIAACMALLVGGSIYFDWTWPQFPREQEAVYKVYATAIGERSSAHLEDGSLVTLDTNTQAKVRYGDDRSIQIESGQVLFEVAKADQRPFVVYAGDRRVVATGTVFNVRVESGSVEVALLEGAVTVDRYVPGRPQEQVGPPAIMQPGERLVAKLGGPALIDHASGAGVTAWTTGKHIFKDAPLQRALEDVNRYTDKPLVLDDPELAGLRVNGVFPTGRPQAFAEAIAQVNELAFSQDADGAIRFRKKQH